MGHYRAWGAGIVVAGSVLFGIGFTVHRAITTFPASAQVVSVAWSCVYREPARGDRDVDTSGDCSDAPRFQQIRRDPRQLQFGGLQGTATVAVRYRDPAGKVSRDAVLTIDSALSEFYAVTPGQTMPIRVNRWKPAEASL